jgi:hypothetical protein
MRNSPRPQVRDAILLGKADAGGSAALSLTSAEQ